MNFKLVQYLLILVACNILSVWGDTFIETFTGGRIKGYLEETKENYINDKELLERYKTFELSQKCFIFNDKELKHHNVTATYAIQKVKRRGDSTNTDGEETTVTIPESVRLFPNHSISTPVHANVYIVPNIKIGTLTFYDLRLSYSSSTPAQFNMDVFNIEKFETFFPGQLLKCCEECQNLTTTSSSETLIILITANYDGVTSETPTDQHLITPYNIVFEPYLFHILPRNVLPLLLFMGSLALFLVMVLIPRVFQQINHIKQE